MTLTCTVFTRAVVAIGEDRADIGFLMYCQQHIKTSRRETMEHITLITLTCKVSTGAVVAIGEGRADIGFLVYCLLYISST